jgi:hypothetical protein
MTVGTEQSRKSDHRTGLTLIAGGVLCLVASGGLLWWRYGGVVFNDMVVAALAWCF